MPGPNPFFDNFDNNEEQFLHDGLVQESIEIYGEGMYYMPRRTGNFDGIYTEDDQDYFDTVYLSTFYIENVEGFQGEGQFLSKFGLEIRDQITLVVSRTLFINDVGQYESIPQPEAGDLIYFPKNDKVFEITFVNKFQMFFPFGASPSYTITCQLFEYTSQRFITGIPQVDKIQNILTENLYDYSVLTEDGASIMTEDGNWLVVEEYSDTDIDPLDQTDIIQNTANGIIDFTESDPFSNGPF